MYEIIVIGTSWGGLSALSTIISTLPSTFALPIVVVQHRSPVAEVDDKMTIAAGHVYVAPPNYHLLVERGFFSLTTDAPVRYSRPSIDVTFGSVADAYGRSAIGIVLTGANEDGALGLKRIADRGGYAIVQDPETAEGAMMPRAAWRMVPRARVLPLELISSHLVTVAPARPPAQTRRAPFA